MIFKRQLSSLSVVFKDYGQPSEVLSALKTNLKSPSANQILVKTLAAPVNPSDINQIEGVYPSKPIFHEDLSSDGPVAVGGNDGLFEVVEVGKDVTTVKPGDWTIPARGGIGTWRTQGLFDKSHLIKIDKVEGVTPLDAVMSIVNPPTAYRMLTKFVNLEKGDFFIQNAANSIVGRSAIQLGRIWGLKSINIIRDRPDADKLKQELIDLGATHVITESELGDRQFSQIIKKEWSSNIKLALNCVGGKATTNMIRHLGSGAHLVTYGGMSKQPVIIPTGLFIFNDLNCHGYWLTQEMKNDPTTKPRVMSEIFQYIKSGEFKTPTVNEEVISSDSTEQVLLDTFKKGIEGSSKTVVLFK